jgi:hypothetical protein
MMNKKVFFVLTSLACGSLASLAADANKSYNSGSSSSGSNQNMNNPGYWDQAQNNYVITPSAQPVVDGWADFFVTADFIWWKPNLEDTSYATSGFSPAVGTNASTGKVESPHYKWEPGFKVGIGTVFQHDNWDLYLEYTWFQMNQDKHHHNDSITAGSTSFVWSDYFVTPGGAVVPGPVELTSASARAKLQFNVLDLEMGRNFWISKYLTIRPNFGLKFAWIHNQESINYVLATPAVGASEHIGVNQRFFGVGIRGGFDTAWHFTKHWSIYGDLALSALWTDFRTQRNDQTTTTAGVTYTSFSAKERRNRSQSVEPVLELGLGLMYQTWFHQDEYEFWVKAGWEEQVWWDHNRFINLAAHRHGNLTLQGLTVDFGLAF